METAAGRLTGLDQTSAPKMPTTPTAAMMAKVVPDLSDFDRLYNEVIMYGVSYGDKHFRTDGIR
jgi:hypothetical protein